MRPILFAKFAMWLCLLALVACATTPGQSDALDRQQYAWSGAIRWGEIDGAINLVDPKVRTERPVSEVELERYKQVQISSYRDVGSDRNLEQGLAARDIDIGVINRHTLAERVVRYRETWRWDAEAKLWWLTSGLPDLWAGQ